MGIIGSAVCALILWSLYADWRTYEGHPTRKVRPPCEQLIHGLARGFKGLSTRLGLTASKLPVLRRHGRRTSQEPDAELGMGGNVPTSPASMRNRGVVSNASVS
jgi:hypothetical protein